MSSVLRFACISRTRVKDVEEKLDGLIALISARKITAQAVVTAPDPIQLAPPPDVPIYVAGIPSMAAKPHFPLYPQPLFYPAPVKTTFSFDDLQAGTIAQALVSSAPVPPPSTNDVIDRKIIGEERAQLLLSEYTTNAEQQFPFVLFPPFVALGYMRRERPFVLLAILTVGAEAPLQARLALEFRKDLAQAMIVESKNSLDLLQGLLIFCTW